MADERPHGQAGAVTRTAQKHAARDARKSKKRRADSHDEAMIAVLMQFRLIVRSIRRHYRWVEIKCGVSGAQLWAMAQVDASPGIKVSELARELAIHQSTASNILDKLEQTDLIERRRTAGDQRVVRLYLTPKGRQVVRRAPKPLRGVLQQALIDLPTVSLKSLQRHLAEVTRRMHVADSELKATLLSDVISDRAES